MRSMNESASNPNGGSMTIGAIADERLNDDQGSSPRSR